MTSEELRQVIDNPVARRELTRSSLYWFQHIYFGHYVTHKTAAFQREMIALAEDDSIRTVAITAFRGSAKSTIMNLAYPLWAIIGKPGKKFVIIVGQTQQQARQLMKNIKTEIEGNTLLCDDMGPFREDDGEWRNNAIFLANYDAKIMAVSVDQSVRGLRHGPFRPDLIICDDIEDLDSAKTRDGREKTYQFVKGDLMPAGDQRTKIIFIGNLLHEDCLLRRLEQEIKEGTLDGAYREYPLIDEKGVCLWPGKYPDDAAIEAERKRIGSEAAWQREYMLKILAGHDVVIKSESIQYYDTCDMPSISDRRFLFGAIGIDLAISEETRAHFTAMISAKVYVIDRQIKVFILPNPINARLSTLHIMNTAELLVQQLNSGTYKKTRVYIEQVAFQKVFVDLLRNHGYKSYGIPVHGDKFSRLSVVSQFVESGQVVFPKKGAEELILQLTGFGKEKYDDLADAFSMLLSQVMVTKLTTPIRILDADSEYRIRLGI